MKVYCLCHRGVTGLCRAFYNDVCFWVFSFGFLSLFLVLIADHTLSDIGGSFRDSMSSASSLATPSSVSWSFSSAFQHKNSCFFSLCEQNAHKSLCAPRRAILDTYPMKVYYLRHRGVVGLCRASYDDVYFFSFIRRLQEDFLWESTIRILSKKPEMFPLFDSFGEIFVVFFCFCRCGFTHYLFHLMN